MEFDRHAPRRLQFAPAPDGSAELTFLDHKRVDINEKSALVLLTVGGTTLAVAGQVLFVLGARHYGVGLPLGVLLGACSAGAVMAPIWFVVRRLLDGRVIGSLRAEQHGLRLRDGEPGWLEWEDVKEIRLDFTTLEIVHGAGQWSVGLGYYDREDLHRILLQLNRARERVVASGAESTGEEALRALREVWEDRVQ